MQLRFYRALTLVTGAFLGAVVCPIGLAADGNPPPDFAAHDGYVTAITFSPDGKLLATGGDDRSVKVWELARGKSRFTLEGHTDRVSSLAFSVDGRTLFSASKDGTVRSWDTETGKPKATLNPWKADRGPNLALSPDGKIAAVVGRLGTVELWDLATERRQTTLEAKAERFPSEAVAIAPDGKTLAFASGSVVLVDVAKGTRDYVRGESRHFRAVAFSPDGKTLAVSDDDVPLFDRKARVEIAVVRAGDRWVRCIAFSPDGKTVALGFDRGGVVLRDAAKDVLPPRVLPGLPPRPPLQIQTEEQVKRTEFQRYVDEAQAALKRNDLYGAIRFFGYAQTLFPADEAVAKELAEAKKALAQRKWHTGQVLAVAEAPDGKTLATGGDDQTVKIWDLRTRQVLFTLEGHKGRVTSVAYSPDGTVLYSAGQDGTVRSWEASTGKHQKTVTFDRATRAGSLALAPDGGSVTVLSALGGEVVVWDVGGTRKLAAARGSRGISESMALSADGQRVAFAGGAVAVFDLGTQKSHTHRPERSHFRAVAFSPDGKTLAVSDNEVRLLDPATLEEREVVRVRDRGIIRCIAFSRDGKRMAVGCDDGLIKVGEPGRPGTFVVLGRD